MRRKIVSKEVVVKTIKFKLLKDFDVWKKGEVFDCFDGIICGVSGENESIRFDNNEWFKPITIKTKEIRTFCELQRI